ncbi:hypothetical protein B2A_11546 [mine drainage metagenome]|uniref:Uncharacterized protein n=1 Tax=mine drainage metagenome TaxID=410659 RepID=T0YRU5_9ZZZZ
MANDIGTFFAAESPPERAAEDVAQHLRRFWEPRIAGRSSQHLREHGGAGLEPLARRAVRALAAADLSGACAAAHCPGLQGRFQLESPIDSSEMTRHDTEFPGGRGVTHG